MGAISRGDPGYIALKKLFYGSLLYRGNYLQRLINIDPASLVAIWPLQETSGLVASDKSGHNYNGSYLNGVALNSTVGPDGRPVPLFDGINDVVNVYSAGLAGAFNGAAGTIACWMKVLNAGVWNDGAFRYIMQFRADANNQIQIRKQNTVTRLLFDYEAGGVGVSTTVIISDVGWIHVAATWDKSADQFVAYVNGVLQGTIKNGLGVFVGALSATLSTLGAGDTTGTNPHSGYLGYCGLWSKALSAAKIASIAIPSA